MDDPRHRARRNRRLANRHAKRILDPMLRLRYAADATTSKRNALVPRLDCGDEVTFRQLSSDSSLAVAFPITGTQGFANIQVQEVLFASHP